MEQSALFPCVVSEALSYSIYLEIELSTSKGPQKHGGFDVTGVQLGYTVNAVTTDQGSFFCGRHEILP